MITSEDVREELARIAPTRRCDRLAELSALSHAAGSLHLRGHGEWALHLDLGSGAAARRAFALLRDEGLRSEIRTYQRRAFDRATRYQLHVEGDGSALDVLVDAGVLDRRHAPRQRPPRRVVARACCRAAYLRGAFLGGGTLSIRRAAHLELRTSTIEAAVLLQEAAGSAGTRLQVAERPTHVVAYAKTWDDVESLLALTGAAEAVLALEERVVLAATREQANRLANADHANLVRTTRAARAQLQAAEALRAEHRLEELPGELREAAELRMRFPTESLRELARRTDPPASKAAMHRRLRRLEDLARA
ncbi:MAG TPA: DNA-binding protein WhiA [Gaiellaceae bacterium]|nr:DNA-binding protein WhiA [Gaiellaceae bacterium]